MPSTNRLKQMLFLYNLLQLTATLLFLPLLLVVVIVRPKYRSRILRRLGLRLTREKISKQNKRGGPGPRIWIHALSVGEVKSVEHLVGTLRRTLPHAVLMLTVSTDSGERLAGERLRERVDLITGAPLDFFFTINRFLRILQPDLFILVETDFWPNWLSSLEKSGSKLLLVNGRISDRSFAGYQRFSFFFQPLFDYFSLLCMQTEHDADNLKRLGISADKIHTPGNLKFARGPVADTGKKAPDASELGLAEYPRIIVAGSVHGPEEEIVLRAFAEISRYHEDCALLIAPRDISRSGGLCRRAGRLGFEAVRRSAAQTEAARVVILDTYGELAACYFLATLAFIGGSLVNRGGHNPLEAAVAGVPVLFGPHMEDFREIAGELLEQGAARRVEDGGQLAASMMRLLNREDERLAMGRSAARVTTAHQEVLERYVRLISTLLSR